MIDRAASHYPDKGQWLVDFYPAMKKINYKSDFDFILRLRSCDGQEVGWPGYDWTAKFYTSQKVNPFMASCRDGVCVNCYNDNGQIHIVCNNHRLGAGRLSVEFHAELPNGIYPDGVQDLYEPQPIDIELVSGAGDCPSEMEVDVLLPYINGGAQVKRSIPQSILPLVSGIKRRIISTGAQPGIVYRNYDGIMRLVLRNEQGEGYNRVADLSGLYYGESPLEDRILGFFDMHQGQIGSCDPVEPIRLGGSQYGFSIEDSGHVPVIRIDGPTIYNFITIRRDDKGRRAVTLWKGAEYERPLAPPNITDLHIDDDGNDADYSISLNYGRVHVQTWRRGGHGKIYKWRGDNRNKHLRSKCFFNAACSQRTVFARVRRVVRYTKSEWVYLRLHRERLEDGTMSTWKIYPAKFGR